MLTSDGDSPANDLSLGAGDPGLSRGSASNPTERDGPHAALPSAFLAGSASFFGSGFALASAFGSLAAAAGSPSLVSLDSSLSSSSSSFFGAGLAGTCAPDWN